MEENTQSFSAWCPQCGERNYFRGPDRGGVRKALKTADLECCICGHRWPAKTPAKCSISQSKIELLRGDTAG